VPSGRNALPLRVLIVSDEGMFVDLLQGAFGLSDDLIVAGAVSCPDQAVEGVVALRPDVALVAECSGQPCVATVASLRQALPDMPTILLADAGHVALLRAALLAGCSGFVTKDQSFAELVNALRAVRDGCSVLVDPKAVDQLIIEPGAERRGGDSANLSRREYDVLELLVEGCSTAQVADRLFISLNTARNHIQRVLTRLGAHSRVEAIAIATRRGLVNRDRLRAESAGP